MDDMCDETANEMSIFIDEFEVSKFKNIKIIKEIILKLKLYPYNQGNWLKIIIMGHFLN